MPKEAVTQFGSSVVMIHFGEALFSMLWLIGLIVVAKTGATAIRLGVYLGATLFAFLWDWIQGQAWFFRLTFDDRLVPAFTLDGREEPLFAPLAYGLSSAPLPSLDSHCIPTCIAGSARGPICWSA